MHHNVIGFIVVTFHEQNGAMIGLNQTGPQIKFQFYIGPPYASIHQAISDVAIKMDKTYSALTSLINTPETVTRVTE